MDVQTVNDLHQFLDRLEKRNHDLKLTRQMTIQQAPQIRLIQNTNQTLAEKFNLYYNNDSFWKNQIADCNDIISSKNDGLQRKRQVSEFNKPINSKRIRKC